METSEGPAGIGVLPRLFRKDSSYSEKPQTLSAKTGKGIHSTEACDFSHTKVPLQASVRDKKWTPLSYFLLYYLWFPC